MSQDFVSGFVDDIWDRSTNGGVFWSIKINGQDFGWGKYPPKFGVGSEIEFDIQWNGQYANVNWDSVNVINQVGDGPQGGGQQRGSGRSGGGGNGGGQRQGGGGGGQQRGGQGGGQQRQGGGGGGYNRPQGGQQGGGQRSQGSSGGGQQRSQGSYGGGQSRPPQQQQSGGMSKDDYWKLKDDKDEAKQATIQYQASRNSAIAMLDVLLKHEAVKLPSKLAEKYDAALALLDELTDHFQKGTANLGGTSAPNLGGGQRNDGDGDEQQYDDDNLPQYEQQDQ